MTCDVCGDQKKEICIHCMNEMKTLSCFTEVTGFIPSRKVVVLMQELYVHNRGARTYELRKRPSATVQKLKKFLFWFVGG